MNTRNASGWNEPRFEGIANLAHLCGRSVSQPASRLLVSLLVQLQHWLGGSVVFWEFLPERRPVRSCANLNVSICSRLPEIWIVRYAVRMQVLEVERPRQGEIGATSAGVADELLRLKNFGQDRHQRRWVNKSSPGVLLVGALGGPAAIPVRAAVPNAPWI